MVATVVWPPVFVPCPRGGGGVVRLCAVPVVVVLVVKGEGLAMIKLLIKLVGGSALIEEEGAVKRRVCWLLSLY